MKMKLHYVVKESDEFYTTEHQTFEFVAGPFGTYDSALENKNLKSEPWKFSIVEQVIDVQY